MSRPLDLEAGRVGARSLGWWSVLYGLALSLLLSTLAPALEAQQPGARVHGARVSLVPHQGPVLPGELVAVEDEQLWILNAENVFQPVRVEDVRLVRVQRHEWTASRIALWTVLAGGGTSAGMFGACVTISEPGGCAIFALLWAALWAGVGALSGLLVDPSLTVAPSATGVLRAYARFPQGLPEGYPPRRAELFEPGSTHELELR